MLREYFVGFYQLPIPTRQGDICEVSVFPEISESNFDIFLEVVEVDLLLLFDQGFIFCRIFFRQ